jgi:hypothetical protein
MNIILDMISGFNPISYALALIYSAIVADSSSLLQPKFPIV